MRLGRLVATVALVLIASAALADVKWEQLPDPAGHSWISQEDICNPYSGECADDFLCEDGFPVTAVEWWGTTGWGTLLPDHYIIRFYSDVPAGTGGISWSRPGDLLYEEECLDFTAEWDPSLAQWHFYQDLGVPFCQELGTIYWFSVVGVVCYSGGTGAFWCDCLEDDWWNDVAVYRSADLGYPDWIPLDVYAPTYGRNDLSFVLHGFLGNVICDPDPLDLVVVSPTGSIDVDYLGGGGGLLYGYSVTVTWDDSVADLTGITEGSLLSDAGATTFFYYGTGGTRTIDCALLDPLPGVSGPGTLFTLAFSAASPPTSGTSTVALGPVAFRDNANAPLSGFHVDCGWINVDVTGPVFTDVSLANLTLGHTDDYAKNTDNLELTADVTDDYSLLSLGDIVANLSGLISGGGTAVVAEEYTGGRAKWTAALANVTLTTDGVQSVTVTATDWLGNSTSDSDGIIVDNTAPGTVAGFAAAPAHQEVALSWSDASGADANYYRVLVRYDAWGAYPLYDTSAPAYPAGVTAGDGEAFWGDAGSATHAILPRDIHYYSAFVYDWALNVGGVDSGGQDRSTNYWLGDVANTGDSWVADGLVTVHDINKLGGAYAIVNPAGNNAECNVGPTHDHSRVGIPLPHDGGTAVVNFEDLMIFSMNYGVVAAKVVPFLGEPGVGDLALALVENGRRNGGVLELALRLEGNLGDVKGLTAELEFEGLEFLSARLSDDMSSPLADVFFWSDATSRSVQVDAAVLGTDVTIGGSGDVVLFTFQVLDETYSVDFASAQLRGAANEDLTAELEGLSSDGVPVAFKLVQNAPNPFNPVTKVAYHVPSASRVTIRVFDVTGRLVTTLVDGVVEPGRHTAVWNGTNDAGESVGSGVYFCTMETPDYSSSHKMTLLK
jgi:hypothetical protein